MKRKSRVVAKSLSRRPLIRMYGEQAVVVSEWAIATAKSETEIANVFLRFAIGQIKEQSPNSNGVRQWLKAAVEFAKAEEQIRVNAEKRRVALFRAAKGVA